MSRFGSLGNEPNCESERDVPKKSNSSFLNSIQSIPIGIGSMHSSLSSSNRSVKPRTTSASLGMFDMEGIDDLNQPENASSYRLSDDEEDDEDDQNDRNASESDEFDSNANANEDESADDDLDEAEQAEEAANHHFGRYSTHAKDDDDDDICVGSLRVGSLAKSSYLDCFENEENEEQISNLPIKITPSKNLSRSRRIKPSASEAQYKQYAQSLPITIPNWKVMNNHQVTEDQDIDWMSVKDRPECIAESIKALARSVRDGTEMFGDLPTRKFTASDLVKTRPS